MTDEQLLTDFVAGDESAFSVLYHRYAEELLKCANKLLPHHMRHLADEVVQNTFTAIHKKAHTWRAETPLRNWIFTIAKRKRLNLMRHERRHHRCREAYFDRGGAVIYQPTYTDEREFRETIEVLSDEDREIMRQVYLFRRPLTEIAESLGLSYRTAYTRYRRVLLKLKLKAAA